VVPGRDPGELAGAIGRALSLDPAAAGRESLALARRYALSELPGRIGAAWPVLA